MLWLAVLLVAVRAQQVMHEITTGGVAFTPQRMSLAVGDSLFFAFPAGTSHAVVQSSADAACAPLDGGWRSKHYDLTRASGATLLTFAVNITTDAPVFFYCPEHCLHGMFGAINAPDAAFDSYAAHVAALTVLPPQPSLELFAPPPQQTGDPESWKKVWGIVVGVAGGIAALLAATCCGCWCCCGKALLRRQAALARVHNLTGGVTRRHAATHDDELPAYEERNRDVAVQVPHYDESAPAYAHPAADDDVEMQTRPPAVPEQTVTTPTSQPTAASPASVPPPPPATATTPTSQPRTSDPHEDAPPAY